MLNQLKPMKIIIFGASGKTGMEIVKQALAQGLEVCAFVRDLSKMTIKDPKLQVVKGDILDFDSVDRTVSEADAVLLALGSDKPILAKGTENIISAMERHGVKRLIVESSYPMSGSPEGMQFLKGAGMTEDQIAMVKPAIDDKIKQESEVAASGLDWIIVRPLILSDGEKTGNYRVDEKLDIKQTDTISRADVADFMLKSLTNDRWLGKTVELSY